VFAAPTAVHCAGTVNVYPYFVDVNVVGAAVDDGVSVALAPGVVPEVGADELPLHDATRATAANNDPKAPTLAITNRLCAQNPDK